MKLTKQTWQWLKKPEKPLELIELGGRTCYQSSDRIASDTAALFVSKLIRSGHESILEHATATVKIITNRGVMAELTRHRLASYSIESTRYVRYDDMKFIEPVWWDSWSEDQQAIFIHCLDAAASAYKELLKSGCQPQQAREVLPNALKTEIVMTANLREWRHIFKLRTSKKAHPQIRALMFDILAGFRKEIPVIFDDIGETEK